MRQRSLVAQRVASRRSRAVLGVSRFLWAAGLCAAAIGPAHAGIFDDDEARKAILSLRTQIEQTQQTGAARQAELQDQINILKRSVLDLNNQLELAKGELARLRGQDEQGTQGLRDLARDVAEFQRKQKDSLAALEERMRKLEPQRISVDGRDAMVDADEKKSFEDALVVLRKGDFSAAVAAFQGFGRRFPDSAYSGQAKYWLGSAQYGKGDLKDASTTFRSFVASNPDHPRAPDALLSLANCQAELKDIKAARKTLEELLKQYPQSEAARTGRDRLAMLK